MRAAIIALVLAIPGVAHAQGSDRVLISLNAGIQQPAAGAFTSTATKPLFLETAKIDASYTVPQSKFFDGGVLFRVAGGFGVGVAVSSFTKTGDAPITGSIPHPFFFNTPRTLSATASSLERSETGVHVQLGYVGSSKHVDVAVTGGPTFFSVNQDLVADVAYADAYPHDTVTFTSATVAKASATKMGFNVGADVGVKFSKHVGVGGLIRYSRATVNFPLTGSASGVSTDVGGLQAGGGVRLFF